MNRRNNNLPAALKRIAAMSLLTVAMVTVSGSVAAQDNAAPPATSSSVALTRCSRPPCSASSPAGSTRAGLALPETA